MSIFNFDEKLKTLVYGLLVHLNIFNSITTLFQIFVLFFRNNYPFDKPLVSPQNTNLFYIL